MAAGSSQAQKGSMEEFNAQNLANTVWAFATLEETDEALTEAAARRARGRS